MDARRFDPIGELQRGLRELAAYRLVLRAPAQAAGDHEVDDDEEIALQREHDALADAPHAGHAAPIRVRRRR
jgi:hypothetical protein